MLFYHHSKYVRFASVTQIPVPDFSVEKTLLAPPSLLKNFSGKQNVLDVHRQYCGAHALLWVFLHPWQCLHAHYTCMYVHIKARTTPQEPSWTILWVDQSKPFTTTYAHSLRILSTHHFFSVETGKYWCQSKPFCDIDRAVY